MKLPRHERDEASAAITQSLLLVLGFCGLFVVTTYASDPSWWSSPGTGSQSAVMAPQVVTNSGVVTTNYVPNPYAVVTQGQLKQFTARAVDELNAELTDNGGAGTNLNNLVFGWEEDYATNGYSAGYRKPSDYTAMNVGQLKYIGNLVWDQLVLAGYTNTAPSWLAQNTNTDYALANLGQLKEVFNFDLSGWHPPGPITSPATITTPVDVAFSYAVTAAYSPTSFSATGLPSGVSINTTNGVISGTPTATGIYNVNLSAINASGTGTGVLVIDVTSSSTAPVINSPTVAVAAVSTTVAYQITASHNPTLFGATGLPTGLSINPTTGAVSGTVTTTGTYTIDLSASNESGTGTAVLSLAINSSGGVSGGAVPTITSSLTATATAGTSFTYTISATNSPTSYGAISLPAGLSIDTSNGVISGTPASGGDYSALISASNAYGASSSLLMLTVADTAPVITSSTNASATVGELFSYYITASNNPTGYSASSLPSGLTLDSTNGVISGTPISTGTSTITLGATNAIGTGSNTLTLTVAAAPSSPAPPSYLLPIITSTNIAYATVGEAFSYTITGTNSPTSFSEPSNLLTSLGLSLDTATGVISGTPTAVGTPNIVIAATNSFGSSSSPLVIVVQAASANVTSTVAFQNGLSPTDAYATTSAVVVNDPDNPSYADETWYPGYLFVGNVTATASTRTLLGFDLSPLPTLLPPGAVITGASLTLTDSGSSYVPDDFAVKLYQASGAFDPATACWTNSSSYQSPLLSCLNVTTTSNQYSWTSTTNFVSAVQDAATNSVPLYLVLVAPGSESSGTVENLVLFNESASPSSDCPLLTITYAIALPPVFTTIASGSTMTVNSGSSFSYSAAALYGATSYSSTNLPSGLSIDSSNGEISGTSTAAGSYQVTLSGTNGNGTGTVNFTLVVGGLPSISSTLTTNGTINSPFTYTIVASNTPTSYSAANLPSGLSCDPLSGVISGTPTINSAGTYDVGLAAINAFGSGTNTLVLTIAPTAPVIVGSAAALTVNQNVAINTDTSQVPSEGQPTGFSLSGFSGSLDLSVSTNGVISGTPTVAGTYTGTITATNSAGSGAVPLTVTVIPLPVPAIPAQSFSAITGSNVSYTVQATVPTAANSTSVSPTDFVASNLPTGLSISATNGIISGTPSASISSTSNYTVTVSASDVSGTNSGILTVTVFPSTGPGISSSLTAIGAAGQSFSYQLSTFRSDTTSSSATGLPPGLTTTNDGADVEITGTPTSPGIYDVSLSATDTSGTSTATLVLTVNFSATSSSTATAQVGVPFSITLADNYFSSFQAANLPPGLSFNSVTGVISGTPLAADTVPVDLMVTDYSGTHTNMLLLTITNNPSDSQTAFQQGISPTTGYIVPSNTIAYDTTNSATANETFNTGTILTVGQTTATASSRALLAFDLSSLPANAVITSATLVMNASSGNSSGAPLSVEVHQTSNPFAEATANWTNNNLYNDVLLSSLTLNPASLSTTNTFPVQAILTQTAQQAYNQGEPLYLTLVAPEAEQGTTADYIGFITNSTSPAQNPQLIVTYTVGTAAAPVITSAATVTGTVNVPLSYTITASNNPQQFAATNLPSGFSVNATNGVISGTDSTVSSTVAIVSASNSVGSGSRAVTFNIDSATPATSLAVVSGSNQVGAPGTFLSNPLVVKALYDGTNLSNALVSFTVASGGGGFATTNTGSPTISQTLTRVTDGSGNATVYFLLPQSLLTTTVIASAGTAQPVSLVETSALNTSSTNDSLVVLSVLSGEGQSGPASENLPQPFVVQASNASGQPVSTALSLTVTEGSGEICTTSNGSFVSSLSISTNGSGQATIYLQPGGSNGTTNLVSCVATAGVPQPTAYLTALTYSSSSSPTPGGGTAPTVDTDPTSLAQPVVTITPESFDPPDGALNVGVAYDYADITISWGAVAGASTYKVDRLDDSGVWETIATTSSTNTTDYNLYSNINYQYRVTAQDGSDASQPGVASWQVPLIEAIELEIGFDPFGDYTGSWAVFSPYTFFGDGAGHTISEYGASNYRFIFNQTRTASDFTWYSNGTQMSCPTYDKESPLYSGGLTPSLGLVVDSLSGSNSIPFTTGGSPGGVISQGSQASFSIGYFGILANVSTVTINYSGAGSSYLQLQDSQGNPVPNGKTYNAPLESTVPTSMTLSVIPSAGAQTGDEITITLSATDQNNNPVGTQTFTYTYQGNPPDFSIPIDEASGARYRKIALNGVPMADEKPQESAESDQEKEETYIDALTLGLRHSTTDVYMPVSGSDFSVSARRDFRSQVWDNQNGLRPHEQPDLPFGMCWSSNLAPNIKFTHNDDPNSTTPDEAIVTDETGAVHTFFRWYDANGNPQFFPMPTAKNEAQVPNLETLTANTSASPVTYTFIRKYGATLTYQTTTLSQTISNDRLSGNSYSTTYLYARLIQAVDRVGNTINYQFSNTNSTNLVPETITVANQPGIKLYIQQTPTSSLAGISTGTSQSVITAIWDANGNETTFGYSAAPVDDSTSDPSDSNAVVLTSVTTPDGATTHYAYDATTESDLTPHASGATVGTYSYVDISSITDPLSNTYAFTYNLDHSKLNYMSNPQVYTGYYVQSGSPRNVATVTMPDSTSSSFVNHSLVWLQNAVSPATGLVVGPNSLRQSIVTDATGFTRTYTFGDSDVIAMPSFPQPANNVTESKVVAYQSLNIAYGTLGSETFQFDVNSAMALSQITDFSGNVTTFAHADAWSAPPNYSLILAGATYNGYYDDPTMQTDALGHAKTFTYDLATRIMTDVVDENGNHTHYDIDELGRRVTEKIYDPSSDLVQETDFTYGSASYPGFMTKKCVKALGGSDPGWVTALVTAYVPDANGRVAQEIVDPNGLHLVTTYTYDANGNKLTATDPRGNTTWFSYDTRNRLVTVTNPDGTQKQMVYDARGNKTKDYDENGIATLYQYDALNRLTEQARDMNGNGTINSGTDLITSYTYNEVNSKLSTTDPNGGVTSMAYDNLQRVTTITDAMSNVTTFSYGANSGGNCFDSASFKPTETIDPRGFATDVAYDALYRPVSKAVQYGASAPSATTTAYDNVGNAVRVTDPLGHQTATTYDALNRPLVTSYADGSTSQQAYTSTGFKWEVIDENGNTTRTQYDTAGQAISVTAGYGTASAATTTTAYDASGNVAETVNPLGNKWDYVYDARNRKVQELEPAVADASNGNAVSRPTLTWDYDPAGRVVATIDPRANETDTFYDPANRVTTNEAPDVPVNGGSDSRPKTCTTYDLDSNVLTVTDPNSHTTSNTYDPLNRLLTSTDAAGIVVTNTYDQVGNKLTVKDGLNHTTSFAYDGLNRLLTTTDPAGHATTLRYDAMNKVQRIDALGQTTSYLYDVRNRLSNVVYNSTLAVNSQRNYCYDGDGNLLSVTEPSKTAADVAYTYDPLNRVITETSQGLTHDYTYDTAGNRLTTVYGSTGRTITSTYDALNRLATMQDQTPAEITADGLAHSGSGRLTGYGYDLNGNIAAKTLPNGDVESETFDALNRTEVAAAVPSGGGSLYSFTYGYDLTGNVTGVGETYPSGLNNRTVANTYDTINRLTQEAASSSTNVTTAYVYDNANNRSSMTVTGGSGAGTTTYTYNNLNQVTAYTNGTRSVALIYDADGNRVRRVVSGGSDNGTDTYTYDFENRLIGLVKGTSGGAGTYAYTYDYRTRRIVRDESSAGGVLTNLVFSGGTSVQEYAGTITGANLTVEYLRGSDYGGGVGGILYTVRGGVPSYTHVNKRGDIVAKTDSSGSLTYQAQYQAFGQQTQTAGSTADRQKSNSKDTDPTNLVDEGVRYRDLETGEFITRDPAGMIDGPNEYTYVIQNPWTKFDAEGLFSWSGLSLTQFASDVGHNIVSNLNGIGTGFVGAAAGVGQSIVSSSAALVNGQLKDAVTAIATHPELVATAASQIVGGAVDNFVKTSESDGGVGKVIGGASTLLVGGGVAGDASAAAKADDAAGTAAGAAGKAGDATATASDLNAGTKAAENAPPEPTQTAEATCGSPTTCFTAGTLVLESGGEVPIEDIHVGDRVLSKDALHQESITEVDTSTWKEFKLRVENEDNSRDPLTVEALRSPAWIKASGARPGSRIWFEAEDVGVKGWATVEDVEPCSPIKPGVGRVVLTTFTHFNNDLFQLQVDRLKQTLEVTGLHRIYSATRHEWVRTRNLHTGEMLQTYSGVRAITGLVHEQGAQRVYNFEVEADHTYFVSDAQIFVHNACGGESDAAAEDGIIYLRTDSQGAEYVGQAESDARYAERQTEHAAANPTETYTFQELERVPANSGRSLDVAEEDWIRAGGGPQSTGGTLQNARHQMSDSNYQQAGGTISYP